MGDQIDKVPKPAKRAAKVAVVPAGATATTGQPADAAADEAVAEVAALIEPASIEAIEAASPVVATDTAHTGAAEAALATEGTEPMATVSSPTEGMEKTQAIFGDMTSRFKTAFEKSTKLSEELVDFTKGNVEAMMASARVAAKAGESLGQEAAEFSKRNFENATAVFKSFATVKSPTEFFQLQSDFAKQSFDSAVSEASRVSENLLKIAGEIAQPISNRYAVAAEKFKAAAL